MPDSQSRPSRPAIAAMLAFVAVLTSGCGGTPDHAVDNAAGDNAVQTSGAAGVAAGSGSFASSFTVNPTEDFKGFNADDWNSQQSWVECNCGNNQPIEPQIMTWNPGA